MMHDSKGVARLFAAPFAIWAAIFIVLPLFFVFYHGLTDGQGAFTLANLWEAVQLEYLQALGLSVELALISTLICLVLAYPLCMILQQIKRGRMLLIFLLFLLPLWMNSLLTTMAWQTILEKNGIINSILHALSLSEVTLINTPLAIVIGMVYNFLPFMVLPIYNVLVKIDKDVISAARDLGAGNIQTFTKIILPLSVPGIISGIVMVFLPSMTNYVVLDMLYNSTYVMGSLIGSYFAAYDWHNGSMIALVLLLIILIFTLFTNKYEGEDNNRGGALL